MQNKICLAAALLVAASPVIALAAGSYAPVIVPAEFSTTIDNPFFTMPAGKKMNFKSKTGEGDESTEIIITGKTRKIMGVDTLEYWDRVSLDGVLIEDTHDYIAQHKNGDVWYFGEAVDNYENGKLKDHHGTWLAGEDNALPGIWVKAKPVAGEAYREEYYVGEAEDMAKVVSTSETVTTAMGTFSGCLKTRNWTPLEPDVKEEKFYCRETGGTALEVNVTTGERDELIRVEHGG